MSLTPLSGTLDLVDSAAELSEFVVDAFRSQFRRFGYRPIAPPVLERATAFLDRSGEDIRRRMYIFVDPGGEEVCLRPELTIPTARLYANRIQGRGGTFRSYYVGPVFRFDSPRDGRYRQFTQAGVELIGDDSGPAADAEVLALAHRSLEACGVRDTEVVVSDVGLFNSLFGDSRLSPLWRARLTRLASDPTALFSEVTDHRARASEMGAPAAGPPLVHSVSEALKWIDPAQRSTVVAAIMEVLGVDYLGARSPQEIAERLMRAATIDPSEPLDDGLAEAVLALLDIDDKAPAALRLLEEVAALTDSQLFREAVTRWNERLSLFDAYGLDVGEMRIRLRLRRGIDYYTGFVFEIHTGHSSVSQICAGGRYDELVRTIGGREGAPAVGFAAGVERVVTALSATSGDRNPGEVNAVVVSGGDVPGAACVRVATTLRNAGLDTEIVSGHRTRYALRSALRRGIRYLVVVGEEELARDEIVVRDLELNQQQNVSLSHLSAFASALLPGRS